MVADLSQSTVELTETSYCHLSVQLLVSIKLATTQQLCNNVARLLRQYFGSLTWLPLFKPPERVPHEQLSAVLCVESRGLMLWLHVKLDKINKTISVCCFCAASGTSNSRPHTNKNGLQAKNVNLLWMQLVTKFHCNDCGTIWDRCSQVPELGCRYLYSHISQTKVFGPLLFLKVSHYTFKIYVKY